MCKNSSNNLQNDSILLKYKYICSIRYIEKNDDIASLILLENKRDKYLFYKLSME